jgi:hypothetical protein
LVVNAKSDSVQMRVNSALWKCAGCRIYNGKRECTKNKKSVDSFMLLRNRLRPIPNLSACPGARDLISVAILFVMKKKGAMIQKTNVRLGKTKMDKMVGRRELPCVRH